MRKVFKLAILFLISSCASLVDHDAQIYVLKNEFVSYWKNSKNIPANDETLHRDHFIKYGMSDGKHFQLYMDSILANKTKVQNRSKAIDVLESSLREQIPLFKNRYKEILEEFDSFEPKIKTQIRRFNDLLPDFKINEIPIYGFVTLRKSLGGRRNFNGQEILIFGIDEIVRKNANFDILFAHEAYHSYQFQSSPQLQKELEQDNFLLITAAFIEGLATYASGQLNPGQVNEIYLDEKLKRFCLKGHYKKYIKDFLNDSKKLTYKNYESSFKIASKWFYTKRDKEYPFPPMAGYCIGERVLAKLGKKYSLFEMTRWPLLKAQKEFKSVLLSWRRTEVFGK